MKHLVKVGNVVIGSGRIVVQTMCNTHTDDIDGTVAQTLRLAEAGAELVRITVPGLTDVPHIAEIHRRVREAGCSVPLVADIHFSADTAIACASVVEKVRINPGNFHKDHDMARAKFTEFLSVCKEHGTAVRIGLNHGSLGAFITEKFGNTPRAMAEAAMEWIRMAVEHDFYNVVVSLKASNTVVMVEAYRLLQKAMEDYGHVFPLHVGVTEAGNGDSGRIKSCVGIASVLSAGIGDTVRVSLTEDPAAELPVARYLAERYSRPAFTPDATARHFDLPDRHFDLPDRHSGLDPESSRETFLLRAACDWGPALLDRRVDDVTLTGSYLDASGHEVDAVASGLAAYLRDELLQAARRRFYKPEYIACPGCGRTMYNLQEAFEEVKAKTAHLKDVVIAVMGCVVNGPGEMADADWGYGGEGNHKVSIYKGKTPLLRHIPDTEAADRLVALIEADRAAAVSADA